MTAAERDVCHICAARLHGQRPVAAFGLVLGSIAMVALLGMLLLLLLNARVSSRLAVGWSGLQVAAAGALAVVCLLALFERVLAARLSVDERLFEQLGAERIDSLQTMDKALLQLQLVPQAKASRSLDERVTGTMALLRYHSTIVLAQGLAMFTAAFCLARLARLAWP
jgi:hypothetical protein